MKVKNKKIQLILVFLGSLFILLCEHSYVHALSAAIHIPEKYTSIETGERLYFELEIKYPENPERKDLHLDYRIMQDDRVIVESQVLRAIETHSFFTDYITIPEDADAGLCTIYVTITDYEDLNEQISASFDVVKKSNQNVLYFSILLGVIIVIGLFIVWEILRLRKHAN